MVHLDGGNEPASCVDGTTKDCIVMVGEHNGVVSCYEGIRTCEGGVWGACEDGQVVKRLRPGAKPPPGATKPMSLSDAGACQDNPCDPSCQVFDEEPDAGLSLDASTIGPEWVSSTIQDLEDNNWPEGLFEKGLNEPCFSGMDCQYDQYCYEPHTGAACAHSKCSTGSGLDSTCDECVTAVCAEKSSCCDTSDPGVQCLSDGTACPGIMPCCHGLSCVSGTCQPPEVETPTVLWQDTFGTDQGWTYGTEWSRGSATASSGQDFANADPDADTTSTSDNQIAGAVIGGNVTTDLHGYYYLTSPEIDTSAAEGTLTLQYQRWLNSDWAPWMNNRVQVHDGTGWTTVWESGGYIVADASWRTVTHDITAYKSSAMRIRFGYNVGNDYAYTVSGWNLDDVTLIHHPVMASCQAPGESCADGQACCEDSACVGGVCDTPNMSWTEECIGLVGQVCNSSCPKSGTCDHDVCLTGGKLTLGCDPCVDAICAADPSCCWGEWDNHCVAKVGALCNLNCNPPAGECRAFNPGEINPACVGGPDLTAGVPCDYSIPICNRGDTTVAANTTSFFYFPGLSANDNTFTTCELSQSLQNTADECPIDVEIPPGECRSISCAALGNNGGIVVNPLPLSKFPSYAPVDECSCQNNWSLFKKPMPNSPPCGAPVCQSSYVEANIPTVNMYIMFDRSGSMEGTRWDLTTGALRGFIRDPASAGMRVALRFFPSTVSGYECGGYTCTDEGCKPPQVDLGALLDAQTTDDTCSNMPADCGATADLQECELVKAIRCTSPNGWTPLLRALGGATDRMGDHAWSYPMERSVVVLVTDGYPEGSWSYPYECRSPDSDYFVTKAESAYKDYGVLTYTVNVVGGDETLMQAIATAGHGEYFYVSDANAKDELTDALNQIRENSVSCDLLLDATMGIDPDEVQLSFTDGGGTTSQFTQVTSASECGTLDSSWHFDDNVNPTKVVLCPETCARVRSDIDSKLELVVGCPTEFDQQSFSFTYTGSCPPGAAVQWGQLTWSALTPGNSTVTFQARTADDLSVFSTPPGPGDLAMLGVAHDAVSPYVADTQECSMFGPEPDCPVDVYDALGIPDARYSHLELTISLKPSTTGASSPPQLFDWNLTYSCPPSE